MARAGGEYFEVFRKKIGRHETGDPVNKLTVQQAEIDAKMLAKAIKDRWQ